MNTRESFKPAFQFTNTIRCGLLGLMGALIVITSYSIHYTKLYETQAPALVRPGADEIVAPDVVSILGA